MNNEKNDESPIFITGVYRSGTTLLPQILNNHSQLRITFDSVQFLRFHLGKYNPIEKRYKEIVNEVTHRLGVRYSLNIPKQKILKKIESLNEITYKNVYSTIMRETFCEGHKDLRWGEKSVLEWTTIPNFLILYPEGKTIHIIRDPRDVLASYREFTIEPKYRYLDAAFTCLHSMNWAASIGESLPKKNYYVLKHEDLITEPEETTKKICNFLEIEYEPDMLNTSNFTNRNRQKKWETNTAFKDIKNGISIKSKDRWKSNLKRYEIMFIESIVAAELLNKYGYEPSGIEFKVEDLQKLLSYISKTPLIQNRLLNWFITGEGIESYPSDPTNPANWAKIK